MRVDSLWGQKRVPKVVGARGARVDGAAQIGGASRAEAWGPQAVVRDGDLQQRHRRGIGRLGPGAERRSFDDHLEGAGLGGGRGDGVVVGGREGVRAGVASRARVGVGGLGCVHLLSRLMFCNQVERQRRGGFGARGPGAVEALLPFIARRAQRGFEGGAVRGRRRREDERVWLGEVEVALVARAHDRPGGGLATTS